MGKWVHPDVLDFGIAEISEANSMRLLKSYTAADSYATVIANSIAAVGMVPGDYAITTTAGSSRTITTAIGKSTTASATSGTTPDLHIALIDTVASRVLWVTDETTDQVVTPGNTVEFPALTYKSNQPT